MSEQYIFTIENLTKAYGKREVLKVVQSAMHSRDDVIDR